MNWLTFFVGFIMGGIMGALIIIAFALILSKGNKNDE